MFRWKTTAAALLVASLALAGCTAGGSTEQTDGEESLVLSASFAPTSYDPASAEWGNRSAYYQAVFDTLLLADTDGTIQPWLATEWSYNDDNTVLTLTLRDDVTFTDGSKLTADVAAQNLQRFKDGSAPSAANFAGVTSFEATDDTTLVITLAAPDPAFLNYLTRDPGVVGSAESFDDPESATKPVGSGPYILDTGASVSGSSYEYTKNPDYWNPDVQHYDKLTIRVLADPTAILNAIKADEVDVALILNTARPEAESAGFSIVSQELDVYQFLLLDRAGAMNPALGDVRVRQAINYSLDRDGLLQAIDAGFGTPTTQVFPERSDAFDPTLDDAYPFDPEKAKELLADAGYDDGLTLALPSTNLLPSSTWTLIGQQLAAVGITVEFTDTANNFIADVLTPKFPAVYMPLQQNEDWELIQFMIAPNAIFNPFHSTDPTVEELLSKIQYGDEAAQAEGAKDLNKYLVEEAWFAPVYRVESAVAAAPDTVVERVPSNVYPSLYDIQPAS
jgi:peptide/nickel transport system substrate-binding protein